MADKIMKITDFGKSAINVEIEVGPMNENDLKIVNSDEFKDLRVDHLQFHDLLKEIVNSDEILGISETVNKTNYTIKVIYNEIKVKEKTASLLAKFIYFNFYYTLRKVIDDRNKLIDLT